MNCPMNENKATELLPKEQKMKPNTSKLPTSSDTSTAPKSTDNKKDLKSDNKKSDSKMETNPPKDKKEDQPQNKSESKRRKKGRRKARKEVHTNPTSILEEVLAKSSFKVANLSQIVEERFNSNPFKGRIREQLRDIRYLPTVGETIDGVTDIVSSVLPFGIDAHINLPPAAITSLPCINMLPEKRKKRGKNKGKKGEESSNVNNKNKQQMKSKTEQKIETDVKMETKTS